MMFVYGYLQRNKKFFCHISVFEISSTDYQLSISDYEPDSDDDFQWCYSKDRLSILDDIFKWKHQRVHQDYFAMLLPSSTVPIVVRHTCTVTVKRAKRYCYTLPKESKTFSVQHLLHYNNIKKKKFARSRYQRHYTYKHRRKLPSRKCTVHRHKLFVKPKIGHLFKCDPNSQKTIGPLDSSVLYPQKYKYTKPDTEFIFESEEENSDTDTMMKVELKTESHSSLLQEANSCVDSNSDSAPEIKDIKPMPIRTSVADKSNDGKHLFSKLKRFKARKRQLEESIYFQEQVLKRMKFEYQYFTDQCDILSDKIDMQRTLQLTGNKTSRMTQSMAKKVEDFKPIVKAEIENCEPISSNYIPPKKEPVDLKSDLKSEVDMKPKKFKHICGICDQRFMQTVSFTDHLKSHTGFSFKCEKCTGHAFTSSKAFKKHKKWHSDGEQLFKCPQCSKTFEFPDRLASHKASHEEPKLVCRIHTDCGKNGNPKRFTFPREHKQHEEYTNKPKMFQCMTCDGLFKSPRLIRIHHHKNGHNGIRRLSEEVSTC